MNRKLLIFIFCFSCSSFRPADPLLVEHAIQNETDEGFISRDFFQVRVEVPLTFKEISGRQKRDECKKIAYIKREEKSLPYLLEVHRNKYRFGEGINSFERSQIGRARIAKSLQATQTNTLQPTANLGTATQTTAQTNVTPQVQQPQGTQSGLGKNASSATNDPSYNQTFAWFYEKMEIYKEDYTDKSKCTFLFRNIQKDLYAKVEETVIPESIYKKEESLSDEIKKTNPSTEDPINPRRP